MNATPSKTEQRRKAAPIWWAGGSTLLLHGAFLAALWMWPPAPVKPEEKLLVVDLKQDEPVQKEVPTAAPTPVPPKPVVVRETPQPTPRPEPTPQPKLVREKPIKRRETAPIPTAVPVKPVEAAKKTETAPLKTHVAAVPQDRDKASSQPRRTSGGSEAASSTLNPNLNKPSGGNARRRFARSDEPEKPTRRLGSKSTPSEGGGAPGRGGETAGALPGLDLPRTRTRRGRSSNLNGTPSSAPTTSKDGTEVEIGPSSPSTAPGGS
ncbi:hypothetical protein EON80_02790, partial [bacterium]